MAKALVTASLIGKDAIIDLFSQMGPAAQNSVKRVIAEHSLIIASNAKRLCPVRKAPGGIGGRLRASITPRYYANGLTADVGTNVEYAPFVEFGTGRRGAGSLPSGNPLPDGYVHGPRAGMGAQPYLFPAFIQQKPKFEADLKKVVMNSARGFKGAQTRRGGL